MAFEAWILLSVFVLMTLIIIYTIIRSLYNPDGDKIEIKFDKKEYLMGEPVTGSIVFHFGKPIAANALYAGVFSTGGGKGDENAWETSIFKMIKKPALLCTARTFNDGESFQFSLPVHKEIIEYCKGQLNPPPYDNQIERLKWDIIYRNPRKWLVEATLKTDKSSISNTVGFKIGTGSSGKKS